VEVKGDARDVWHPGECFRDRSVGLASNTDRACRGPAIRGLGKARKGRGRLHRILLP
jgi:hypothetical protein